MQATGRDLSKINCYYSTATSSAIIRTTAPTSRQPITGIGDADNGTTSSEADINRISRSRADSSSKGEGGKCGAHTIRPPPAATPIAAPGRQTGPTATSTSPKFALRVSLRSAARGISLGNGGAGAGKTAPSPNNATSLKGQGQSNSGVGLGMIDCAWATQILWIGLN